MSQFPYLTSLVNKNEHYKRYFRKSEWIFKHMKETQDSTKFLFTCTGEIHWKKLFHARFQAQNLTVEKAQVIDRSVFKLNLDDLFKWKDLLDEIHTKEPGHECALCHDVFGNQKLLQEHLNTVHPEVPFQHCYLSYFKDPAEFKAKDENDESCQQCHRLFQGIRQNVDLYLRAKNASEKPKVAKVSSGRKSKSQRRVCELCSKILSNRKGLERHMLIHTGEKPFPCDVCGKQFRRKDNCARHKKTAHLFKKPRKPRRKRNQNSTI